MVYDFHDFFDGILGVRDLLDMEFSIVLINKNVVKSPLFYRLITETSFTFSVDRYEILKLKIPVNI